MWNIHHVDLTRTKRTMDKDIQRNMHLLFNFDTSKGVHSIKCCTFYYS